MSISGYVYLSDISSNRQDIITIIPNSTDSANPSHDITYKFSKKTLSPAAPISDFSLMSYHTLKDIASKALVIDKNHTYPIICTFEVANRTKHNVKFSNTNKDIFPVPHKSDVYLYDKVYFDITYILSSSHCLTTLVADIYCRLLEFVASRDGYVYDRLFVSKCGRVFLNATYLASTRSGRSYLNSVFPSHKHLLKSTYLHSKCFISRSDFLETNIVSNDYYTNPFLKIANDMAYTMSETDYTVFDILGNSAFLSDVAKSVQTSLNAHFPNLLWQGVLSNLDMFDHITLDDLLSLSLPDGRENIRHNAMQNRKFYNAHKGKNILALYSDGSLVLN